MDPQTASQQNPQESPLAVRPVGGLLYKFAVPAVISMLVGALYNVVDQIFIGQGVGMLGNAATNVAFPLNTLSVSLALLLGIGSASNFNLAMGRGEPDRARGFIGTGVSLMIICGVVLCAVVIAFLEPLLYAFGATEQVLPYALTYTGITSLGLPFLLFSTGGSHLIRADGCPTYSMVCTLSGAVLNTILDPLFIFTFDMGMAGAAWATVIGQVLSAGLAARHFARFKTMRLSPRDFRPRLFVFRQTFSLGLTSFFNQIAMALVQVTMNNTLTHYGAGSAYGSDIPLAAVGVISKVNILFMALFIGIAQGCQPIIGFNYGAKNYDRVKKIYFLALKIVTGIAAAAFLCFQIFPRQITGIFGSGSEEYFRFAERYFRIYMMFTIANGVQPMTATFFTSIGKARRGIFISLTRQITFLLPMILIFPVFFGIDGVMYAGPIADLAAVIVCVFLMKTEMVTLNRQQAEAARAGGPEAECL